MKARILVAEDDPNIRQGLVATLESEGYDVTTASDGAQALKLLPQSKYDLLLLDVMMPKLSGYDVCREWRMRDRQLPILFLTAKGEEIDKVLGLKLGADDYVTKPFGVHELLARIEALLRRSRAGGAAPTEASTLGAEFKLGSAAIDRKRFVVVVDGEERSLTARELKLAEVFGSHRGEVLSRDALLNAVWGTDYLGTTRTPDQHVAQLRKKIIGRDGSDPIATIHGVGYRCDG